MRARYLGVGCAVLAVSCVGLMVLSVFFYRTTGVNPSSGATAPLSTATPRPSQTAAVSVDPRQLDADPKGTTGRNVVLTGALQNVIQRDGYTWTQFMADVPARPGTTESLVAYWRPNNPALLKGDKYRVWAIVKGEEEVTRELTGATARSVAVDVYAQERLP